MAGGGGDIVQNIVLAGQDDVIAGLNSIGSAGVQAFTALGAAAASISLGGPLGAITGFAAALATVTAGFFEWSASSSNATIRTANFGDELGTSAQQMTTLIVALAQGGNQVTDLTTSFRRLAVSVESEWPTIQKAVRNSTNLMKEDYIKVGEANIALQFSNEKLSEQQQHDALDVQKATLGVAEAKQNLVKTDSAAAIQMQANAVDVLSAEGQLSAALFALDHARKPATKSERADQAEQQANIAALQAQIALERAIQQTKQEHVEAALKHRQAVLAINEAEQRLQESQTKAAEDAQLAPLRRQQAELAASKAQSEEREHQANDIKNLKQYVDNLATGASNADSKVQLSSANLVKGLIASVGPGVSALDEFKGSIGDLGLQAPKLYDVMLKVSDIFKNTTDETLRAAIATALFGRGYSFSLVEALSKGSEAIKASQAQIASTFDLTKERVQEQVEVARDFRSALNTLGEGIGLVSKQISTIITPVFSAILREIEGVVESNRTKFLEWATTIRDNLTPAITGFISSIAGVNIGAAFNLSPEQILKAAEWKQTADNIKDGIITGFTAVKNFLTSTLPAAFGIVMGGFNAIASVINSAFGTSITGAEVGIALLIGQFTGLNGAIIAVVTGIGAIVIALAANPFGVIALAAIAATAILAGLAVEIYKNRDAINSWLTEKHDVSGGAFQWIADAFEDVVIKIQRGLAYIRKNIDDTLHFRGRATIQVEDAEVEKKNAQEDSDRQAFRQSRDNPVDESAGLDTSRKSSSNASSLKPQTAADAWKSLGTVVDSTLDKTKQAIDSVGDASKASSEAARKAAQDLLNQAQAADQADQKRSNDKKKSTTEQTKDEKDRIEKLKEADAASQFESGGFAHKGFAKSIGSDSSASRSDTREVAPSSSYAPAAAPSAVPVPAAPATRGVGGTNNSQAIEPSTTDQAVETAKSHGIKVSDETSGTDLDRAIAKSGQNKGIVNTGFGDTSKGSQERLSEALELGKKLRVERKPVIDKSGPSDNTLPGFYRAGPGEPEYPIPEQEGQAKNKYEFEKEKQDQAEFSAQDGKVHRDFTKGIRRQLNLPDTDKPQHGIVPHPGGGKADLSERMTIPGYEGEQGPYRYRYIPDPNYQPPELGHYDYGDGGSKPLYNDRPYNPKKEGGQGFIPNKNQPYGRLRSHPFYSDRPYSKLEDTFDMKGQGDSVPIYDTAQSQPVTFPKYNQEQRDSLPVPLPQPRPAEAPPRPPEPVAPPIQVAPEQRSEAQPLPDLTALGSQLKDFITAVSSALPAQPNKQEAAASAAAEGQAATPAAEAVPPVAAGGQSDSAGQSFTQSLNELAQAVTTAAQQIASAAASAGSGDISEAGDIPGHDTGGTIGGKPGRDTNLIYATRGEFMQSKPAVEHYGESFMHALNQRRVPKQAFWSGGMIGSAAARISTGMIPRYESGGVIAFSGHQSSGGGGAPTHMVSFHAADGREVGRGMGDRAIVEGIQKFATAGSRFSTGRAQTWRS